MSKSGGTDPSFGQGRLSFPLSFLFFSFPCLYCFLPCFSFRSVMFFLPCWYSDFQPCIMFRWCVELWCFHQLGCFQQHHFLYVVCLYWQCCSWVSTGFILVASFFRLVASYLYFVAVLGMQIGVGCCD